MKIPMCKSVRFLPLITGCVLLAACSAMTSLKKDLAQLQTKQSVTTMPNGSKVHFNTNLSPTRDWGCRQIGQPQSYNWAKVQMEAQYHFKTSYLFLINKGIDYLVSNNLTANYINAFIPEGRTVSFSNSARTRDYFNIHPRAKTTLYFYQCKRINPQYKLGSKKDIDFGIGVGAGANNTGF